MGEDQIVGVTGHTSPKHRTVAFLHVECRRCHAFFRPAKMNLAQLQWDLNNEMSHSRSNSGVEPPNGRHGHYSANADDMDEDEDGSLKDRPDGGGSSNPLADALVDAGATA